MRRYFAALLFLLALAIGAPAAAHPPYGLVVDPAGNAFFSDLETVWRLDPGGGLSAFRPRVAGTHVHELALAPDGAIEGDQNRYDPATERYLSGLWRRSAAGAERALVPMTERPPPGMGVLRDGAGNRYSTHWRSGSDKRLVLLRRRPDGTVDTLFDEARGGRPPPQPSVASVGGMVFGADGALFFADRGLLRSLAREGTVATVYDGGPSSGLRGIAAAADGRIFAADSTRKQVLAVATDGTIIRLYRETGGWLPTAIALHGSRLLVLEANADPYEYEERVRVIEVKDGRAEVIAQPAKPEAARPSAKQAGSSGNRSNLVDILLACLAASAALFTAWRLRRRTG